MCYMLLLQRFATPSLKGHSKPSAASLLSHTVSRIGSNVLVLPRRSDDQRAPNSTVTSCSQPPEEKQGKVQAINFL